MTRLSDPERRLVPLVALGLLLVGSGGVIAGATAATTSAASFVAPSGRITVCADSAGRARLVRPGSACGTGEAPVDLYQARVGGGTTNLLVGLRTDGTVFRGPATVVVDHPGPGAYRLRFPARTFRPGGARPVVPTVTAEAGTATVSDVTTGVDGSGTLVVNVRDAAGTPRDGYVFVNLAQ